MIRRPTSVDPVNEILSTLGSVTMASPTGTPGPGRTLTTPGGMSASAMIPASSMAVTGVSMAGFSTTVFPVAMAGAIFQTAIMYGTFHGMIWAHTPNGDRSTNSQAAVGKSWRSPPPPEALEPAPPARHPPDTFWD